MKRNLMLVAVLAVAACAPEKRDPGSGGPDAGSGIDAPGVPPGTDDCSDAAKLIYVVDENNTLSQFDPMTKSFTDLGRLTCPAPSGESPFSMGIDRDATAWVLYSNGELFRVDTTTTGLPCTKASWAVGTGGFRQFGMGFSTDAQGGTTDSLYIAGGPSAPTSNSTLAKLDLASFAPTTLGNIQGAPELTGTGNAELWGFFPDVNGSRVSKLDKVTGAALTTYPLIQLAGDPLAWAFAFHGGDFWIFLMKDFETSTTVYQLSGQTGQLVGSTRANGRTIVGAGVSTCAPVIL